MRDVAKMYGIFRYLDSYLGGRMGRYEVKESMEGEMKELLTWGIIVYNKNSVRESTFQSIQRSKNSIYLKIIRKKEEIIRTYYSRSKSITSTTQYRTRDLIHYAHFLRTTNLKALSNYNLFLSHLVDLVFHSGKRANNISCATVNRETNVIQDEEEEVALESCNQMNKIGDVLGREMWKKQKMF